MISRSWDLPTILTSDWWMEHIGAREKGKTLFPNLTTGAVFRLAKAKALKAFIDPVFGMDYQLGLELMLSGPTGYLAGIHGVERKHEQNDGFNAPLETVASCFELYGRVLAYGRSLGLPEPALRGFCRRFMNVMVTGFVLYTWSRERGVSIRSAHALYQRLSKLDPALARNVMSSPRTLARFFIGGSPKRQEFLRRLYYKLCQFRNAGDRNTPPVTLS
jgi:hypothetical protein